MIGTNPLSLRRKNITDPVSTSAGICCLRFFNDRVEKLSKKKKKIEATTGNALVLTEFNILSSLNAASANLRGMFRRSDEIMFITHESKASFAYS